MRHVRKKNLNIINIILIPIFDENGILESY